MPARHKEPSVTAAELSQYETLLPLLEAMHADITALSLKSQTAVLSKSRIAMINRLLVDVQTLLKNEPTAAYLQLLDELALPQNADALLILGQFKTALDQFQKKYTYFDENRQQTYWRTVE